MDERTIDRMAELLVGFGANVQPGQMVAVGSDLGKEQLTRAICTHCYRRGAVYLDVSYFDRHLTRARILHASDEALGNEPGWTVARPRELGEKHGALIGLSGPVDTDLLSDLDPDRLRRDRSPGSREWMALATEGRVQWTVGACPTPEWAALVHPDLDPDEALSRLWDELAHMCRLDADDPVAAWEERGRELSDACDALTAARFDALNFEGPGTDLTVGLLPSSTWKGASDTTPAGIVYYPNLPTEEVFTAPDPARADGVVSASMPLVLDGTILRDLVVTFEGGRAVSIEASSGADVLRSRAARDEGASRLGEVALVDGSGRIGALQTVFYDSLLDENAASHIALGNAYAACVEDDADRARVNESETHVDFMIGSPDVTVTGIRRDGGRVPVLSGGSWQI